MKRFTLEQFENFLKNVDLDKYRDKYSKIKTVEMDLPPNIQALQTIYEQYWDNVDNRETPPSFEEYYEIYWNTNEANIYEFWDKTGFGKECNCFKKGLEARIYRTWASLITQIQGGYVAEKIFGKGCVHMGTDLDHKNVDILITNPDNSEKLRIQIKKDSHRPEIARMQKNVRNQNGAVDVYYIVPTKDNYDNPLYRRNGPKYKIGDEKPFAREFVKWHPQTGTLDRLDNGFVIFTEQAFRGLC